ncbi:hypothetical protein Glove_184g109 [Diversispora epigaea]|uniref:Uncharacterized protein n=1 Tax=Diversispora epigaea TaxID=1348612 RepID=A0A397IMV0_9GLOM|nr:hypothetical protein Glove_184g109 [Diversispora epigaea]
MNSKFISFALSIFILSIILSVAAHPDIHKYRDSSELFKRHDTCPCTVATSTFNDTVIGEVVFAQDTCGKTLVTGLFSDGLVDPEKNCYTYLVVDKCGNLLYDLTKAISPKYRENGTFPFSVRLDDLNLNCNEDGVLLAYCDPHNNTHYRKRDTGANLAVQQNGQGYASAPLTGV